MSKNGDGGKDILMKQKKYDITIKKFALLALSTSLLFSAFGCSDTNQIDEDAAIPANAPVSESEAADDASEPAENTESEAEQSENEGDTVINVVAVGDDLVQQCVYQSAQAHSNDGVSYNFDYCYENIKPLINGDLNIINQETLICGEGFEVSGSNYNFNSPMELGNAVLNMGFNVVTMCNNHLLDKGEAGLHGCLNYWDTKMAENPDLLTCGVYRDYVDMQNIRTKEVNGKTVAFLSYTENTNGYSLPDNSELEIIYTSQEDLIQQQITAAKQIADVVVVTCHWGAEDTFNVTDGVRALAQKIIDWGGDVIIGTHSHVAHTMEYLTRPDGTQGFVFYSLGNFISAQTDNMNLVGELADFNIVARADGSVSIENVQVSPVITHYEDGQLSNLRLYPYSMYSDELASQHGLPYCTSSTGPSYQVWSMDKIREMFETSVPEEFRKWD
ncbi:CapA family protein [Ruminococcus sp.]|uniref:CapA family protein n=1 Tax=Ruminococcus sp. TaxID=41978 RepID=UPI0025CE786C|nr:CapA family protein [Ruminococcus sp.]